MKIENHTKVYELFFENEKELSLSTLIKKINNALKTDYQAKTSFGSFYIKEMQIGTYSYILLFGKDNEDASNYKRNKEKLTFTKININQDKEVLTDFIHINISKKYDVKNGKINGCTIFLEKSSLILLKAFEEYINHLVENAMLTTIRRRVTHDYYEKIKNAKRIVKITQTKKDSGIPAPLGGIKINNDDITVDHTITIKPEKKGGTIPFVTFDKIYKKFNKNDKNSKMAVDIKDESGVSIPIDFDKHDTQYSIKYSIPINLKKDTIQKDIKEQTDWQMHLDQEGK